MFLFKASRYLEELEKFRPDILLSCKESLQNKSQDDDFIRVDDKIFEKCPSESIDYAVMEKTEDAVVVPLDVGWNDIGAWTALWDVETKDEQKNVVSGDAMLENTTNSFIHGGDRLIAAVGLDNVVIVDTKDALLVAKKEDVQDVKKIVEKLKLADRSECKLHREVYRPWGKYDSIDKGDRYQVKRITVNPGEKLSIQMHHHRAEHWIVVSGTASVTNGDTTFLVTENESTYIPIGVIHALENPGKVPLEMIEVQSGSYLGEDDIVRFEDRYGRA
jgi:mannose-1-phosphate guanylyltransferase